ncbi:MAG: DNA polymerase III subunit alpha [Thermomicrobiales bacterium]
MAAPYAELHLHTSFSFLDGASQPDELIARAVDLGYTAIAITDHDTLSGAMEFAQFAHDKIQAITGAEITLADGSHLTLLAESRRGYANLCRIITAIKHDIPPAPVRLANDPEPASTTSSSHLADFAGGLILLTGCRDGQLARLVDAGRLDDAETVLRTYIDWFGKDQVFVELQQHYVHGDTPRIARLAALAHTVGLPCVATGNVHYHRPDRHRLQDVLVSIKHRTTLDGSHRQRRANAEFYLHTPAEMESIFAAHPDAIANTRVIADRCSAFDLTANLGYSYPERNDEEIRQAGSQDAYLARICRAAFAERYGDNPHARQRMEEELVAIRKRKLAGFFLLYREIIAEADAIGREIRHEQTSPSRRFLPPGRTRGSAVSSVVCYLLGLSAVDPLEHNLYIGRFLHVDGDAIPDIDLDFPREIREKLIVRLHEKYGSDHAAMIAAFSTYHLRGAVRDVGKVLDIPAHDLDRIARLSDGHSARSLGEQLRQFPEYAARVDDPPWSLLIEMAHQLAGFPRHITQHSGGMVISTTPLNEMVPIQPAAMEGRYLCQWDKDSVSDARFVKIDFLALGMLSLVEECLDLIDASGKGPIDLGRIDFEEPAIFRMIQEGDTIGTFQVESRAQIQMIRQTKPQTLKDLVVQVAIVRPGPIVGGAVTPFVQRRLDPDFVPTYDHPLLEDLLEETLGVVLYQEQVVQVAERIAGFTAGQADDFRRAMTRKRSPEAFEKIRADFMAGAAANNVDQATATRIFAKLKGFAAYGFPKSHAAAFALLAYQSCWLRYHHPAEFLCALLNNQPMGFYSPHVLINDARRHGLRVLQPDINQSDVQCTVIGARGVRIGLAFVKEVGEDAALAIVAEREARGPFRSLSDLVRRVPLRSEAVETLILSGAISFGLRRRELLWQAGLFIPSRGFTEGRRGTRTRGHQLSLPLPTIQDEAEMPRMSTWEQMTEEYRLFGHSTWHPMELLRQRFPGGMVTTQDLESLPDGMPVHIPGLIVCRQRPGTAKGITFLLLEDEVGLVNVVVYPDLYKDQRFIVRGVPLLIVEGTLQRRNNTINVVARRLHPIENKAYVYAEDDATDLDLDPDAPRTANPAYIHFEQRTEQRDRQRTGQHDKAPRSLAEMRALAPSSHNYR